MEAEATRGRGGKLTAAVRLALFHPEWNRPCEVCKAYVYKDDGRLQRTADGEPAKRISLPGLPVVPTPCARCPKVPQWAKDAGKGWEELQALAVEATAETIAAYEAYREFKATGYFPDDDVVRWYSAIIREIEDERDRLPVERQTQAITQLMALLLARRK